MPLKFNDKFNGKVPNKHNFISLTFTHFLNSYFDNGFRSLQQVVVSTWQQQYVAVNMLTLKPMPIL